MRNEPLDQSQVRELVHGYHAAVSYIDALIGQLLDALEENGLRENTIIVLWGDHGWHLGEQGLWAKLTSFEASARVPLIVVAPNRSVTGAKCHALVEFVDLYPTLCELVGLPVPSHLEGTSLVPLLARPEQPWKTAAFTQVVRGAQTGRSIRTADYRFTRWHPNGHPENNLALELYDLSRESAERVNVVDRPENNELVNQLQTQLDAGWKKAVPKFNP
jgi:arylsulfatase A-like enzyme